MGNFVTSIELYFQDNFSSGFTKAGMLLRGMKDNLEDFATRGKVFDDVAAKLTIMTQSVQNVANMFGNLVDEPRKLAMGIEDGMAMVNSLLTENVSKGLTGAAITTKEAYDMIKNEALSFSKDYVISADEFIKSSYSMISAGLDTGQALSATSQSVLLAKATMGDASDAANLLADLYNNMGDKVRAPKQEFERLSDVLTMTQNLFKIDGLGQLSEGLKYGIPTANAFGISIEQLSAAIGQLNTSGIAGSMAGTTFSAMLSRMSVASGKIGFEIVSDESGGMDLIATLQNAKNAYLNLQESIGSQETANLFLKAFGQEAFKGVSNLMTGMDSLSKSLADIETASQEGGFTLETYNKITDTTSNRLILLQNRKDVLKSKMGELMRQTNVMGISFNSAILSMQEKLLDSKFGQGFAILSMNIANIGKGMFNAMAQGMQFTASLMTVVSLASKGGAVASLAGNFVKLGSAAIGVGKSFIMSLPAVFSFNSAFLPIAGIIIGIIAIGTAVFFIIKYWKPISEFFKKIFEQIKGAFSNLWNGILNNKLIQVALSIFTPFIGIPILIIKNWNKISGFFSGLWGGIVKGFKSFIDFTTKFIESLMNRFKLIPTFIKDIFESVFSFIMKPFEKINNFIAGLFGKGKKVGETLSKGINSDNSMKTSVEKNLEKTSKLLPKSDAKEGPFSTLTLSGKRIMSTLSSGVLSENSLEKSINDKFSNVNTSLPKNKGAVNNIKNINNNEKSSNNNPIYNFHINTNSLVGDVKELQSAKDFIYVLANMCGVTI